MTPRTRLILSATTIALLWQLPYGAQLLYPLTLLATFAHAVGASFEEMLLHADGSGMAVWHGNPGRLASALIAAGGLLGPSLAGVSLLLLSRAPRFARAALLLAALLLLIAVALWVRNGRQSAARCRCRLFPAPDGADAVPVVADRPGLYVFRASTGQRRGIAVRQRRDGRCAVAAVLVLGRRGGGIFISCVAVGHRLCQPPGSRAGVAKVDNAGLASAAPSCNDQLLTSADVQQQPGCKWLEQQRNAH